MTNAFMASANKAKQEQRSIQTSHTDSDDLKVINIRIPADLHYKATMHRVQTGENVTQLVQRLLRKELG